MKRRNFFKRLTAVTASLALAPKLLATDSTEEPIKFDGVVDSAEIPAYHGMDKITFYVKMEGYDHWEFVCCEKKGKNKIVYYTNQPEIADYIRQEDGYWQIGISEEGKYMMGEITELRGFYKKQLRYHAPMTSGNTTWV